MTHTLPFTSVDFYIQRVTSLAPAVVRVRFTYDANRVNTAGANDALNPAQYTITGSHLALVTGVNVVTDDPQAVDVYTNVPLAAGLWTISVSSDVETPDGTPLSSPTSASFNVSATQSLTPVNGGAVTDAAADILRKHIPMSMVGRFWDGIIAAIASSDAFNWLNARLAFDQLFKSSASGAYLDRLANDDGTERPAGIGMSDDLFRRLAIKSSARKLVALALLEILDVFYGTDAVCAHLESGNYEPFRLEDEQTLRVFDGKNYVDVSFVEDDFEQIGRATAAEVAAVITRQARLANVNVFAKAVTDPSTLRVYVRLYSSIKGLSSTVTVQDGLAQNGLMFPTLVEAAAIETGSDFSVESPRPGVARYVIDVTTGTPLLQVLEGDYVNITCSTMHSENRGSFVVQAVSTTWNGTSWDQYFEVENDAVYVESGPLTTLDDDEVQFFRPTRATLHDVASRAVVLSQNDASSVDVVLPATTQAVGREEKTAAYLHAPTSLNVLTVDVAIDGTVTVTTDGLHGLAAGDHVFLDGVYPEIGSVPKSLNRLTRVEATPTGDTLTFATTAGYTMTSSGGTLQPLAAEPSTFVGPYVWDPDTGAAITSIYSQTPQSFGAGRQYKELELDDATDFPDESGWLAIGYGTKDAVYPVRYLGRISTTTLVLDYSFKFPRDIPEGASVTLLAQKGPYTPEEPEELGSFYVTGSSAGRVAAQARIEATVAAGIDLDVTISYPSDKGLGNAGYPVTGNKISDKVMVWGGDNLDDELATARGD